MAVGYEEYGLHIGFVINDKDPNKQGRVEVMIPGLLEPGSWAEVVMPGSTHNRGDYAVPVVGGQVLVGFLKGELESPVIFGGIAPPVLPDGFRTTLSKEDLPKFRFIENEDWIFLLGASGTDYTYAAVFSRVSGRERVGVILDLEAHSIKITAPMSVEIETAGVLHLKGNIVRINDRVVSHTTKPI
jgi:hypothetical protein